jgi:hypothetical protein
MKKQTILPVLFAVALAGCRSDKTKDFIQGTYADSGKSEYSIVSDTLVIEAAENSHYLIHRKTGISLISKGKPGKVKHSTEEWYAIYDEKSRILTEAKRGKLIRFFPEAKKLKVERREYRKLEK